MAVEGIDDLHSVEITTDDPTQSQSEPEVEKTDPVEPEGGDGTQTDLDDVHNTDDVNKDPDVQTDSTNIKSNLSGIEQYLAQFNIEGGMIDFQDGSRAHFDELTPERQAEVLTKLHEASTKDVEARYGLDEDEINLINYVRQQEGTIDEIIDRLAQQRAQVYIAAQSVGNANIEDMDSDAVYTAFLLRSNPEATAEQIENDLQTAKKMSNYEKIVSNLKDGMLKEQQAQIEQAQQATQDEMIREIESQRKEVVSVVTKINDIDGLAINDGIKNDVLDLILNVDEDGDSLFMTQVFSDPKELFKAAFWYKNGADILRSREEYWKKEKSEAFKRGQGTPAKPGRVSFSASDVDGKQTRTTPGFEDDIFSLDDIHNT